MRLGDWPERGAQPMLIPWALRLRPLRRLGAALAWGDWTGWRSRDGLGAEKRAGPRREPTRQVRSSLQELGAWRHLGDHSEGLVRPMGRNPRDTQTSRATGATAVAERRAPAGDSCARVFALPSRVPASFPQHGVLEAGAGSRIILICILKESLLLRE